MIVLTAAKLSVSPTLSAVAEASKEAPFALKDGRPIRDVL